MRRYTHDDMPSLRALRETLRLMIDKLNRLKADESDLGMLVAMATVGDDLHAQYEASGRVLDRLEKTAPGAGRSPASSAGTSMRPRRASSPCAAKGPVIADALRAALERGSVPRPADPLFSRPSGQVLPAERPAIQTQPQEGGHFSCVHKFA